MCERISSYGKNRVDTASIAKTMESHAIIKRLLSSTLTPLDLVSGS